MHKMKVKVIFGSKCLELFIFLQHNTKSYMEVTHTVAHKFQQSHSCDIELSLLAKRIGCVSLDENVTGSSPGECFGVVRYIPVFLTG